jgi:hypothetical protein|tara:strand:- start:3299 stop:5038 length:1740 start_codon:yes stop_codon:yes gene_type:complete
MSQVLNKSGVIIGNNKIIFFIVSLLGLQSLYFNHIYKINFPYAFDMTSLTYLYDYLMTDNFPIESLLTENNSRGIIFPKLLVLPNYLLNNFDSGNLFYLQWIILSLTLFMIFLIIRRNNKSLYWTLIPISAFIFSPLTNSNYWTYSILVNYLPALCIASIIYVLDKKFNLKTTTIGIFLSIVSIFSIPTGVIAWLLGSILLLKSTIQKNLLQKKLLPLWFLSMLITGILYVSIGDLTQQKTSVEELFSQEGIYFIATYLAVPFKLKYDSLMIAVGVLSFFISIVLVSCLAITKSKLNNIFPWILFLITGLSGAIITRFGRFSDYYTGDLPYYIPISEFFQIGICVLVAILIFEIKQKEIYKNKKVILGLLYSIIICQMIFLIPSYYSGWMKGDYYFNEKTEHMQCYSLYHDWLKCKEYYILGLDKSEHQYEVLQIFNYFLKNKLNFFSDPNYNKEILKELDIFGNMYNEKENVILDGEITTVNNFDVTNKDTIDVNDEILIVSGWLQATDSKSVDVIYLIVNDEPIAKYDDFTVFNMDDKFNWNFALLKNYLPDECKKITVAGMKNNSIFVLNDSIQIC